MKFLLKSSTHAFSDLSYFEPITVISHFYNHDLYPFADVPDLFQNLDDKIDLKRLG